MYYGDYNFFIYIIIIIVAFIVAFAGKGHKRSVAIEVLRQLVIKKQLSKEEYYRLKEKILKMDSIKVDSENEQQNVIKQNNTQQNYSNNNFVEVKANQNTNTNVYKENINDSKVRQEQIELENKRIKIEKERYAEKKRQANISILLYLGVTLIILAGLVFATTTWDYLPSLIKAVLLFGFSGMLFGVSGFVEKKMKIQKTSFALWILGTIFLPITCICTGYLEVFGYNFSLNSDSKYLFSIVSAIVCLPIYIISAKKYSSKFFAYISAINITLIAYFTSLNISEDISLIVILMAIYNLISLVAVNNMQKKTEFSKNISESIMNINKITVLIISIIASVNIFSSIDIDIYNTDSSYYFNIGLIDMVGYIFILGNLKYLCMQKKDYLFSIVNTFVSLMFLNNVCLYLIQNKSLDGSKYVIFMFLAIAVICAISNFAVKYIFKNEKWDGLKLSSNCINALFIPIILITSIIYVAMIDVLKIEAIIFPIIALIILIQKRIYSKGIENGIVEVLDLCISMFLVITAFAFYRYIPEDMNVNIIVYISLICYIPWMISKFIKVIYKGSENEIFKVVGIMFTIIPFIFSFIDINSQTAIYKLLITLEFVIVSYVNYIEYVKKDTGYKEVGSLLMNVIAIGLLPIIFIILTTWLTVIPLYFTTFILAVILMIATLVSTKKDLMSNFKYTILGLLMFSNLFMLFEMNNILEYLFIQAFTLLIYFNRTYKYLDLYNIYILIAFVANTLCIASSELLSTGGIILNSIVVLSIIIYITLYNYNKVKVLIANKGRKIFISNKRIVTSIGLLLGLIPYSQIILATGELLNIPDMYCIVFIELGIIFTVFVIEKIICKSKNVVTYVVQAGIYFITLITTVEFADIMLYSILLLILVIIGNLIKNKSMLITPAIALVFFAIKGTMDFWLSIPWWLYLLVGGTVLVYAAMKREINKQKNIDNKKQSKLKEFISNFED